MKRIITNRQIGSGIDIVDPYSYIFAKLKKQLEYANKKMIPFVIVIGSEEVASGLLTLKNMETGEQEKLSLEQILKYEF